MRVLTSLPVEHGRRSTHIDEVRVLYQQEADLLQSLRLVPLSQAREELLTMEDTHMQTHHPGCTPRRRKRPMGLEDTQEDLTIWYSTRAALALGKT